MQERSQFRYSTDNLSERARRHAIKSRESLQIAARLYELFPQVLKTLKRQSAGKGAKSDREALVHPEYLQKIEQYVALLGEGLEARIQFETHRMLLQAMQSQNAYERARLQGQVRTNPLK